VTKMILHFQRIRLLKQFAIWVFVEGAAKKEEGDAHKLTYQIPFEEGVKVGNLLKHLEQNFPNLSFAIE